MFWVLLESEAEADIRYLEDSYYKILAVTRDRFRKALANSFASLETFPLSFPTINKIHEKPLRRVLIRGFSKALLYFVNEQDSEVHILRCYDTRSSDIQPRKT